jgi:hypothetical protein
MAIYVPKNGNATSKSLLGAQEPANATADSGWSRTEPLITAKQLQDLILFGIPLVSMVRHPITGKATQMSDETVKEFISQAMSVAESELGMRILPVQFIERHMWDRHLWLSMGYLKLRERPIASIEEVIVASAGVRQEDIMAGTATGETGNVSGTGILYRVPLDWIDVGLLKWGQLNIVPLTTVALSGLSQAQPTTNGGAAFLNLMAQQAWVPQFWMVRYTVGYKEGLIPRHINRFIGIVAAMDILSQLAATNALNSSQSLGIDALSQGRGTPGPQLYQQRWNDLQIERDKLKAQIKNSIGRRIFTGSV